jgi:hypothetical protein
VETSLLAITAARAAFGRSFDLASKNKSKDRSLVALDSSYRDLR